MIWHSNSVVDVLQELQVDPTEGLTEQEAADRLKEYGKNSINEQHPLSFRHVLTQQLRSPFTTLLLAVSGATFVLNLYKQILLETQTNWGHSLIVAALAIGSAVLGAVWRCHTHSGMANIHAHSSPEARVRRHGKTQLCPTPMLVPGDIVLLGAGDIVPADCRLVAAERLRCDESALTEATMPTAKCAETIFDDITPLAQRTNMLYAGTAITAGTATAVVVATGIRSEMGHSASKIQRATVSLPSQKLSHTLHLWWSIGTTILCTVSLIIGLLQNADGAAVILTVAALAMAAFPTNVGEFFAQLTTCSIRRMSQHHARLHHPEIAETVSNVNVLCAEQETLFESSEVQLRCAAFGNSSRVDLSDGLPKVRGLLPLIRLAVLNCSDNDPISNAILLYARNAAIHRSELLVDMPQIGELSSCDFHAGVHLAGDETLILASGEWRYLLPLCAKGSIEELTTAATAMEADGLHVLAITYRLTDTAPAVYTADALTHDLTCAGLLGLQMPLRHGVANALNTIPQLRTILFSNDPVSSAEAAATQAGLTKTPRAITADMLEQLTDEEWANTVDQYNVYCGLTPDQKKQIVTTLQQKGNVVAVTGSRSEEADLLEAADVGFARGTAATDVAKNAADILLTDANFSSAIAVIGEGKLLRARHWYAFLYLMLCALAIVSIGTSCLFGWVALDRQAILLMCLHLFLMHILPPALVYISEMIIKKK